MTKRFLSILLLLFLLAVNDGQAARRKQPVRWPDGEAMTDWFMKQAVTIGLETLGQPFRLTDHGVTTDSTRVQTQAIQHVIDLAAQCGEEAVVVVPKGTFLTGSLQMRQNVNLYVEKGGRLKGSSDICDFPVVDTRIEGQSCKYFAALINAKGLDSLKICGPGTIDGNGLSYWKAFWLRRAWNPDCTNKDEQRPRLLFLDSCTNVTVEGLTLQHSPFWTAHLYRCGYVRLHNLRILSPATPVKAPSTDAIDIDACHDIHVCGCYMAVNDDAIALKGGKGPYADQQPENGSNERILIEDCEYGFCHGCLTCGSEAVHCRNVVLRRIKVGQAARLLWLKMRPDTPQCYEFISVEDISGEVTHFLYVKPWTQFFDLQGRKDMPLSVGRNITMQRCRMKCDYFFNVERSDQYRLSDFLFADLQIEAAHPAFEKDLIDRFSVNNVRIN